MLHLSRLLNAVIQMLFPFCKPFKLWLVRSGAVQQRTAHLHSPVRQGWMAGGPTPGQGLPCWGGDWPVFRLSDHLRLQGLTLLKDQHLGILIRPSTDFHQQGFNEMTEALIIAQVTAAHDESWFQLFEVTSYSTLSPCPNS